MKGADYVAEFLHRAGMTKVFLMNGGACAFMVDAVARHRGLHYVCVQHEQAAAMAADAVWRVSGRVGATMATSGPGATNLITGIACSHFDSIPSFHVTGQVNRKESAAYLGARVRQAGFQETKIVEMVRPITKYAVQVHNADELRRELPKAYAEAVTGRMGPVLVDVPMDVQQEEVGELDAFVPPKRPVDEAAGAALVAAASRLFEGSERPAVLVGAGVGLSGAAGCVEAWLRRAGVPFVSSWNGMTYFDHDLENYCGGIGVYGNRGANYILQNCDALLVLGSRLENRQRPGNPRNFVPGARVLVADVDAEELKKYAADDYATLNMDLAAFAPEAMPAPRLSAAWLDYVRATKARFLGQDISTSSRQSNSLSPYAVVKRVNELLDDDAIVACDTGACLAWVYQMFRRKRHSLFTAGGNSPMGYALPALIGATLSAPGRQAVCFMGDGGFQLNIQELQTLVHLGLDATVIVMNNGGYGIIKQFQDTYLGSRHAGTGAGYSVPDFGKVVAGYGVRYWRVDALEDVTREMFSGPGAKVVDVTIAPNTLIEPKVEMGRPINDQFPYVSNEEFAASNPFVKFERR